jgi:benzaldehyde dehydrogenase (NAD)
MTVTETSTSTLMDPRVWSGKIFDGDWVAPEGGEISVIEPATGRTLGSIGRAAKADVERAARRAVEAQVDWAQTSFLQRAEVLRRAAALWGEQAGEIQDWLMREGGQAAGMAGFQLHVATQECYAAASLAGEPYGKLLRAENPRLSMARQIPVGVVGVIAPFNAQLILSIRSVAPALALGNAVLLKPDPRTSVSGGAVLARVFAEAGLPAGLLHVLPGGPDVGEMIVTDPRVHVISFTGSTAAGRIVGSLAARHLKRVHLELGGNSALIVLDDVDLDRAVASAAWGTYFHQGQICMATSRHLVQDTIAGEYAERLAATANALKVGNPTEPGVSLGPIIDEHQRDKVHDLVTSSVDAGAHIATGGSYEGLFYRPTVLTDVTPQMPVFRQEIFGPVAPVTPFHTLNEAVALAADTEYGLSVGIMSRDVMKALALAERIPSGLIHINEQTVDDEALIPFGGVGASGTGSRLGGADWNLDAFTETQWVTISDQIYPRPF